jgi:hypothetical protein
METHLVIAQHLLPPRNKGELSGGLVAVISPVWGNFTHCKSCVIKFGKISLGNILDDFFTKASGHPAHVRQTG